MKEAEVILARSAGFCFGVHRAVDTVYERTGMDTHTDLSYITMKL